MGSSDSTIGLLIAHGSPDPRHAAALERLAAQVDAADALGVARCEIAYLEHNEPALSHWLETAVEREPRSVQAIGLLLASGYHASVDIPRALDAASDRLSITNLGTLGAGDWVFPVLERAVSSAGAGAASPVVLVSAGSSHERARADLRRACEVFAGHRRGPVLPAAVTGADPRPEQVVAALTARPADVVVVPLMLAPGALADKAIAAATTIGARVTTTITTEHDTPPELVTHLKRLLSTQES